MKKIMGRIVVVVAIIVCLIAGFALYMKNEMKDLKPLESAKLNDSTYVVKGVIGNMYLVGKGEYFVAFDAADNASMVLANLKKLSINPDFVRAVFLTHSDADHTAGVPLFKNAKVYLSHKETALLDGTTPRHFLFLSRKNKMPVSHYELLNDMDSVMVHGETIRAISTPGHTVGSMCYQVGGMLFTGDLCIIKHGKVEPMLKIFTEDRFIDSLSIRRVAQLPTVDFIATAHSGVTNDMNTAFALWR